MRETAVVASALYPGSFDPAHLGHLSVIARAAHTFDEVVVAVIGNPSKRSGMFSIAERIAMLEDAVSAHPNVRCTTHHGLTVDAARANGCDVVIRTGHKDRADEWSMLAMNELMSGVRTTFIPPDPELFHLSSSLVRSLVGGGELAEAEVLVPAPVAAVLRTR
jgi:pantetheine-phosphate adenylyltransferase